jgi:RNA polymerase sigma-70 factor, ECF subfamily
MDDGARLAGEFQTHRTHLRAIAYRMMGSVSEAEDVVQDAWLRLHRVDPDEINDLQAWLTLVVGRLCLDRLRSARHRRETYVGEWLPEPLLDEEQPVVNRAGNDPADQVTFDDSVGLALMVVLETLTPAQRTAFVLHEAFGVPFDEIAAVVGRSPDAVRKLASRARHQVQARRPRFDTDATRQRATIEAFLKAAREGDIEGLIRVLDPHVVWRSDARGDQRAPRRAIRGADQVAAMVHRRAAAFAARGRIVTVNGAPGVAVIDGTELEAVIGITVAAGLITEVDAVYNPDKLRHITFR